MASQDWQSAAERCHEIAAVLRRLARQTRSFDTGRQLVEIAELFERMAERAERGQEAHH